MSAPVRFALLGGGPGSFIGPVHRRAAELDGRLRLVAGVFSRDADRSRQAGEAFGVASDRVYPSLDALITAERARPDAVQLVVIATPNDTHFKLAQTALEAGLDVMSDKPATTSVREAIDLQSLISTHGRRYGLTYTYCGYPLVKEAREWIRSGKLGAIRKVVVEYSQGWLARAIEDEGNVQARWRTDPVRAGLGGCIADIGVHAFQLAEFVSGQRITQICADLGTVVPGRALDDDCNVLLRFESGARGVLHASQIASGDRNGLRLRIWGETGGIDWSQESPHELRVNWIDSPTQVLHAGGAYLSEAARRASRLPAGHPEGFIEALANLYGDFAEAIHSGTSLDPNKVPSIGDGLRGLRFVEQALASSRSHGWTELEKT